MCTLRSDAFVEPFYSLKKAFMRLQFMDSTSMNIAYPSSGLPIMMTPSLTIHAANIAMPLTSKAHFGYILIFLPQSEHWLLIESNLQVIRLMSMEVECLSACSEFYLLPLVCINPKPLSFIIGNTNIDVLSSHLPTSPPIVPVLNVGLVSASTEMTVACEIPLQNLFAMKLILTFINLNLTVNHVEGPVEGAIDILQNHSPILTGSCLLQIFIFYFW